MSKQLSYENLLRTVAILAMENRQQRIELDERAEYAARRKADDGVLVKMLGELLGDDVLAGSGPHELRHRVRTAIEKRIADNAVHERHWRALADRIGTKGDELVKMILHGELSAEAIAMGIARQALEQSK